METLIGKLWDDRLIYPFVPIGALLIAFPHSFTRIAPYLVAVLLLLHGLCGLFVLRWFPRVGERLHVKKNDIGRAFIALVLGVALLFHLGNAIGALGSIWAMLSLYNAGREIDEMLHERKFPPAAVIVTLISIALAILLLFDPVEHFTFHVRILGIEMIYSVIMLKLQRRGNAADGEK